MRTNPYTPPVDEGEAIAVPPTGVSQGWRRAAVACLILMACTNAILGLWLVDLARSVARTRGHEYHGSSQIFELVILIDIFRAGLAPLLAVCFVSFSGWSVDAARFARRLPGEPMRFRPAAMVWTWLVPVGNLVLPYLAIRGLWMKTFLATPHSAAEAVAARKSVGLGAAWALGVIATITTAVARSYELSLVALYVEAGGRFGAAVFGVLGVWFVSRITRLQRVATR
jgi:hypothetical protein